MRQSKLFPLLALLLTVSCTITRYYDGKTIRKQVTKLQQETQKIEGQVNQDYTQKSMALKAANDQGVNLQDPAYTGLRKSYEELTQAWTKLGDQAKQINALSEQALTGLGTKKKILSSDPEYKEVDKAHEQLQNSSKDANKTLEQYEQASKQFAKSLSDNGFHWADIKLLTTQLSGVITALDQELKKADSKMAQFEKKTTRPEQKTTLASMKLDLKGLQIIRNDLKDFLMKLLKVPATQNQYVVTPKHPQAGMFRRLSEIQQNALKLVDSFNNKAQTL